MGKLTNSIVNALNEPGRYADGEGLYLRISPAGGRRWVLRIQIHHTRNDITIGDARHISLKNARLEAAALRAQVAKGGDPAAERRKAKKVIPRFEEAARRAHAEMCKGWKNGKHQQQWIKTLELYAFPKLGKRTVDKIDGPMIRDVLAEIWLDIPETARRVRQRIGAVLDWCYAKGLRDSEAPMRSLARGLPRQPKRKGHFAALPHFEVPAFLDTLRAKPMSAGTLALELLILTAVRSGEIRHALWSEVDDDLTIWTIPAERMKMGVEHIVPLSRQAADVLRRARQLRINDNPYIFPGPISGAALTDMALLELVRGMDVPVTVHGFRSSFRDWVADETDTADEVAEACLAHAIGNKTKAAYLRTDFFRKRRALMQLWADHCLPTPRIVAMPAQPVATSQQAPVPPVPVSNAAALPPLRRHAYR
jgi:integrase